MLALLIALSPLSLWGLYEVAVWLRERSPGRLRAAAERRAAFEEALREEEALAAARRAEVAQHQRELDARREALRLPTPPEDGPGS